MTPLYITNAELIAALANANDIHHQHIIDALFGVILSEWSAGDVEEHIKNLPNCDFELHVSPKISENTHESQMCFCFNSNI